MLQSLATVYSYNYNVHSSSSTHSGNPALLVPVLLIGLALVVVGIAGLWKVFTKAGRPGWACLIPFYNSWVLFEISGKPGWWVFVAFLGVIPIVGIIPYFVLYILAMLELAKRFGKDTVFAIFGLIIFSFVGFLILGYGDAKYEAVEAATPVAQPPAGAGGPKQPPKVQ